MDMFLPGLGSFVIKLRTEKTTRNITTKNITMVIGT